MKLGERKLHKALRDANSACADLEIAAHFSIEQNNVGAPWRVRSIAMNIRLAVGLAQALQIDLPKEIVQVST